MFLQLLPFEAFFLAMQGVCENRILLINLLLFKYKFFNCLAKIDKIYRYFHDHFHPEYLASEFYLEKSGCSDNLHITVHR